LLYVSPGQINLQIPAQLTATGRATIAVMRGGTQVASGTIQVAATGPSIFTANSAGYGLPAALIVRVKADGGQSWEPVTAPIDFGDGSDRLFLALYGTGIRGSAVSVQIGDVAIPAAFAPTSEYPGLDQVNVELPRSFAGAGQAGVVLTCDEVAANPVTVVFR